ncbi:MAG: N-acetylneuraminate synthase family protein [Candidatus Omnitrophica bacterium]|nr:N-acetylneuraminate synthase family protein [Candidatus Omnitrophota bacterium]
MPRVKIIAEIGENHIGDMDIAKRLIREAAEAGADYVKFQSYRPENFSTDDPEYEWFKKVSLSDGAHSMLKRYAEECGIEFTSSPFSVERAEFLCGELGLKEIKIASGVMLNFPILNYINSRVDTVFLSTGMATLDEIRDALAHIKDVPNVYLLHCVAQYPCEDKEANLKAISILKNRFPACGIGYSDHTIGTDACLMAAALGAQVIEKHFTFDKNAKEGTDHILSLEPAELKALVKSVRRAESLLGKDAKEPTPGEERIKEFVRSRFL